MNGIIKYNSLFILQNIFANSQLKFKLRKELKHLLQNCAKMICNG